MLLISTVQAAVTAWRLNAAGRSGAVVTWASLGVHFGPLAMALFASSLAKAARYQRPALVIIPCGVVLLATMGFLLRAAGVDASLRPRRLIRAPQPDAVCSFLLACAPPSVGWALEIWSLNPELLGPNWGVYLSFVISMFVLRGAALHGTALSFLVCLVLQIRAEWDGADAFTYLLADIPLLLLPALLCLYAATTELRRDRHVVAFVSILFIVSLAQGTFEINGVTGVSWFFGLSVTLYATMLTHFMKWGRTLPGAARCVAFLKFAELRRRRQRDKKWVLKRRQDMEPEVFGNAARARFVVAVSHSWLSREHADPEGLHLDAAISTLERRLCPPGCSWLYRLWFHYYYLRGGGDVVLFVDMSSLYQAPRTPEQDEDFRRALRLLAFLYSTFEVLVTDEIPEESTFFGLHVSYLEKGWCWAEANLARLGGKLARLSDGIEELLAKEQAEVAALTDAHCGDLALRLQGIPGYTPEVLNTGDPEDLLQYREEHQRVKGKVFTCGKTDLERVIQQLQFYTARQQLKLAIEHCDVAGVERAFDAQALFGDASVPIEESELANSVLNGDFDTALHLAFRAGDPGVVGVLLAKGAAPTLNILGLLPWERFFCIGHLRWQMWRAWNAERARAGPGKAHPSAASV